LLLRASGELSGTAVDVRAVVDAESAPTSGIPHAETLIRFTDAVVAGDEAALARARRSVLEELGPRELVDAAAVASNFERMVRIADATGIPLDGPLDVMSADLREDLDLSRFGASANTPAPGVGKRALGQLLRPAVHGALRLAGRLRRLSRKRWR
jgi:hypothetical protein